jgi:hypothetical protein
MPNDLSIQALAQPNTRSDVAAPAKVAATAAPTEQSVPAAAAAPNPTLKLNAALGLVVIEFRNSAGAVVSSIPTSKQIQAYQQWQDSGIGRPPNLGASMSNAAPASASPPTSASGQAQAPPDEQTPPPAQAPTHAPVPATFGGNSHSFHLGIGV